MTAEQHFENKTIAVGGSRGTGGGIHFGHVHGCLSTIPGSSVTFYVISDMVDGCTKESVLRTALDVKAWNPEIHVVRESSLRSQIFNLIFRICETTSFGTMKSVHPRRRDIQSGKFEGRLSDFLFPVYQTAYLLALGSSWALYNDDNLSIVRFARKVRRRLISRGALSIGHPELAVRKLDPPRLTGPDGRKMAKVYTNVISPNDDIGRIVRLMKRSIGKSMGDGVALAPSSCCAAEKALCNILGLDIDQFSGEPDGYRRTEKLMVILADRVGRYQSCRAGLLGCSGDLYDLEKSVLLADESLAKLRVNEFISG